MLEMLRWYRIEVPYLTPSTSEIKAQIPTSIIVKYGKSKTGGVSINICNCEIVRQETRTPDK